MGSNIVKKLDLSYIDTEDLLRSTGIKNISKSAGEITFSCPLEAHQFGDRRPSARMNAQTTLFYCAGCGWRGNAIHFLSRYKQISETVARRLLEERYGGELTAPIENLLKEVKDIMEDDININYITTRKTPSESWIDNFRIDWTLQSGSPQNYVKYMLDRGFCYQELEDWEIGYDQYSNRITIPIRDHEGKLVGFKGRQWKEDPKYPRYMILGDKLSSRPYGFDPYRKSEFVFGLNKIYNNERGSRDIAILCEGELNVLSLYQKGFVGIGVAGSEFSDRQCELIIKYLNKVIVFFDNDSSGAKGTKKVVEMLLPHMEVYVVQNAAGDAAELPREEIQELISTAQPALVFKTRGDL